MLLPELRVLLTGVIAGLRSVTSILLLLALIVRAPRSCRRRGEGGGL